MKKTLVRSAHLLKKPSSWYLRYRLPSEIQSLSGKSELQLSLRTKDHRFARYQVGLVSPDLARFRLINRLLAMRQLDREKATELLGRLHTAMVQRLRSLQEQHIADGVTFSDNLLELEHAEHEGFIAQYRVALRNNEFDLVAGEVEAAIVEQGLDFKRDSTAFRIMCVELLKQKITYHKILQARCSGEYEEEDELLAAGPSHSGYQQVNRYGNSFAVPRLSEAWEEFYRERTSGLPTPDWNENTARDRQSTIEDFIYVVGDIPVSAVTRDVVLSYRDKAARLPKNRRKLFGDSSVEELLELDLPAEKLPSARTIKEKLVVVGAFLNWCRVVKQYLKSDPTEAISVKSASKSYAKFTDQDLRALFHSDKYKSGSHRTAWQSWIPIIALYTGARQNEIAQLRISDVVLEDDIWALNISDVGEGQKVKTAAGVRKVPISKKLLEIGFLDYVSALQSRAELRLFPDLKKGAKGYGQKVSRWFNDVYKKNCGIKPDASGGRKVFHSFRHTAITKALSAGHRVQDCQQVFGHQKGLLGETETYTHGFPLGKLVPVIASLDFGLTHPKFERPHLKQRLK